MAKMFYTLDEAAAKLGKSADEVRQLAQSGRLQEFRDRDKLMFKVDQIDLLVEGEGGGDEADMSSVIPLADSALGGPGLAVDAPGAGPSGASGSFGDKVDLAAESGPGMGGSGIALSGSKSGGGSGGSGAGSRSGTGVSLSDSDPKQKSGVSIFDADELEQADPSAVTQVTDGGGLDDLSLEPVGSGSGLMELTREADDTSLGAVDFLQEVGAGEERETPMSASGLFGGAGEEPEAAIGAPAGGAMAAPAMFAAEPFDGPGSGLVGGLSFGALVALALATTMVVTGMMGIGPDGLSTALANNFWIAVGGLAALCAIAGVVGMLLGKRA